jgi:uncharacterized protein (TIGR02246 family)
MTDRENTLSEINAVLERQMTAWAAGDAGGFGRDVSDEVVFTNIVGMFTVGRAAFDRQHAHIFSAFYKNSIMRQTVEHVAFIRPDVVVVDTLTEVEGGGPFPPNFPQHDGRVRTRLEQVMVREDGRWRVAAFHNVPIPPGFTPAGPPPGVSPDR